MLETMATEACGIAAILIVLGSIMWLLNRSRTFWRICDRIARDGSTELYVHRPDRSPVEQYHERKRREAADRLREGR